jgi:serine/threonine protein kinase
VDHKFPQIQRHSWSKVFPKADGTTLDLIAQLLEYNPGVRLSAVRTMVHPFFNELRDPKMTLPDAQHGSSRTKTLPNLFDFSKHGKFRTLYIGTRSRESRPNLVTRIVHCTRTCLCFCHPSCHRGLFSGARTIPE